MRRAPLLVALAVLLAASGCSSGPSLAEGVSELTMGTRRLETDSYFKQHANLRILQRPDRDIPCGDGRVKRVLRATAHLEGVKEDLDTRLDKDERVAASLLSMTLGYTVEREVTQVDALEGRFISGGKDVGVVVNVIVAPEAPIWRIYAQTRCMS